jgi:hypothetical protein
MRKGLRFRALVPRTASKYRSPRLTRLGRTTRAIRGAWTYSYTDHGPDFYKYGE